MERKSKVDTWHVKQSYLLHFNYFVRLPNLATFCHNLSVCYVSQKKKKMKSRLFGMFFSLLLKTLKNGLQFQIWLILFKVIKLWSNLMKKRKQSRQVDLKGFFRKRQEVHKPKIWGRCTWKADLPRGACIHFVNGVLLRGSWTNENIFKEKRKRI